MNNQHATDLIDAPDLYSATGSGRATWDERGNSIWEWQTEPGVYSRDISSQQLQALQANELSLQEGAAEVGTVTLWTRAPKLAALSRSTELVMPTRHAAPVKARSFEHFLKRLGLPA